MFVEAFPSAKIDGGAMYVDGYPVIGLSGRGKRLDKVLFTLLHEITHILLGHVDAGHYIVEEIDEAHTAHNTNEKQADDDAGKLLSPTDPHASRHGSMERGSTESPPNSVCADRGDRAPAVQTSLGLAHDAGKEPAIGRRRVEQGASVIPASLAKPKDSLDRAKFDAASADVVATECDGDPAGRQLALE